MFDIFVINYMGKYTAKLKLQKIDQGPMYLVLLLLKYMCFAVIVFISYVFKMY
jgi:hypothetical protein